MKEAGNEHLYDQLVKLGDMMGDGLHYEPDGKWIEREYRQIAMMLFPDAYKQRAKQKNEAQAASIINLLKDKRCECGSELKQKRLGSKKCYCPACNKIFTIKFKTN